MAACATTALKAAAHGTWAPPTHSLLQHHIHSAATQPQLTARAHVHACATLVRNSRVTQGRLSVNEFFAWSLSGAALKHGATAIEAAFARYDRDGSGYLDSFEVRASTTRVRICACVYVRVCVIPYADKGRRVCVYVHTCVLVCSWLCMGSCVCPCACLGVAAHACVVRCSMCLLRMRLSPPLSTPTPTHFLCARQFERAAADMGFGAAAHDIFKNLDHDRSGTVIRG